MHILSSIYSTYGKRFAAFTKHAFTKYKKLLFPAFIIVLLGILLVLMRPRHSFSDFTMQLFREELVGNTLNLHFTLANPESYGIENYDISLGSLSVDALAKQGEALLRTRQELLSFKRDKLSAEEQLTYDVLTDYLDSQIALSEYYLYEEPFSYCGGVQVQLPILLAEYSFSDERDVREYLELTSLLDDYLGQLMEFEHAKAEAGLFMSDELCQLTIDSCKAFLENQENHYLLTTFENRLESLDLPTGKRTQYIEMNRDTFLNQIIPAYENLILKLSALMGSGKNTGGLCNFPKGKDYYRLLLQAETGCKDSVDEIFKRIETQRGTDLLHSVELWEANHSIYEDCNNAMPNFGDSEAMLAQLEEAIPADFPTPPATQCRISYVEEALRDYLAPAFYIVAPMDDYLENSIYINDVTNGTARTSDIYDFTTLAHEGFLLAISTRP